MNAIVSSLPTLAGLHSRNFFFFSGLPNFRGWFRIGTGLIQVNTVGSCFLKVDDTCLKTASHKAVIHPVLLWKEKNHTMRA